MKSCLPALLIAVAISVAPPSLADQTKAPDIGANTAPVTQLKIIDQKAGSGATAENGRSAVVHYTGWLYDPTAKEMKGKKFDSSRDRQLPFEFMLGAGQVIRGWDEGVKGMRVHGKRRLTIPSDLGYGPRGQGPIPPDATLIFEVQLLDVK